MDPALGFSNADGGLFVVVFKSLSVTQIRTFKWLHVFESLFLFFCSRMFEAEFLI
jgi:hypothetical protein